MFARRESLKQYMSLYPATALLIVVNIGVWGLMEVYSLSQDPRITLLQFGAIFDSPTMKAEAWRYLTAMFIHIGFAHLFFNCFALYVFAAPLERMLGIWRYLLIYIVSGLTGNIFSMWLHTDYFVSAGASGAIYGIYAAFLFLAIFRKDLIDYQTKQTLLVIVGVGFANSLFVPNIDVYAHLGGFVGGMIMMALIVLSIKRRYRRETDPT